MIHSLCRCFTQTIEIRELLYESLGRAVEFNSKLIPHVLQFIDWHFSSYFSESLEGTLEVNFEKCVRYKNDAGEDMNGDHQQQLEIYDNVGKLTGFIVHCVVLCDQHDIAHDNDGARKLLHDIVQQIEKVTLDSLGIVSF